ncbi:MAG: hypothetical protein Q7R50_01525 [Dehalococcoidales bacterium]|nr:hypothetical protein [Dehalococcoidales bacterium]
MTFAMLYRPELREYNFGSGHPFEGDRFELFPDFLQQKFPPGNNYRIIPANPAADEDLLLICRKDYIDFTKEFFRAANLGSASTERFFQFHSSDNLPGKHPGKIEEAARLIIGQAKTAADLVQSGEYKKAVSIGGGLHHAKRAYGEGFCLYNDVAFTALYLLQKYGLERVLILDTDAHAGNGTMEYFYEEPRVLFIDLHQDPITIYPGTGFADQIGSGRGKGFTINIPLPPYAGDDSYRLAFESIVEPVAREFQPQIIIRNGGSDPHFADGLTNLGLTLEGFRMTGEKTRAMADEFCGGRQIDLIASGYNEKVLPYGWLALISGMSGIPADLKEPEPMPASLKTGATLNATKKVIAEVKQNLWEYWRSLR